jgi:MFS superfamily sulfate permease-like transporter
MNNLYTKALLSLVLLAVVMGLLLFVPTWTIHYWQAWVYLAIFMGASLLTTLYLMKKDPALLKRRMSGGPTAEKERTQKIIISLPQSDSSPFLSYRRLITVSVGRQYPSMS